ncbi:MAG: nucleotidyl transferase AbiEii/AbiGii toxin family protein [Acidobacteria bacterium]|jgi:predicted nucleotidyltransferase|nr:nucleotidyl transferase AbiEii/AbiGii toxin family protein [Acidobacteriota bacterium]
MIDQFKNFMRVLEALEKKGVEYILVGGVAVILHGIERLTNDIDIFVKMDDENIAHLRNALHSISEDPSIDEITLEALQEFAVIRFGATDEFYIDIMARLGEVAVYEDLDFEILLHQGIKIKIATPETLYKLKKDTLRQKDKFDAAYLKYIIDLRNEKSAAKNKLYKR